MQIDQEKGFDKIDRPFLFKNYGKTWFFKNFYKFYRNSM